MKFAYFGEGWSIDLFPQKNREYNWKKNCEQIENG